MMLKCTSNSISTQKFGNSFEENEDSILEPNNLDNTHLEFAISDGATESSFSKEWADLLVSYYNTKSFDKDNFLETLMKISESWHSMVSTIELPWYAQQKVETGAFATFLGLTVNSACSNFEAIAIGDCTMFHIRNDEFYFSFPIKTIEDFGNTPNLIASNKLYQTDLKNNIAYYNDSIKQNDIIILATDALAAWIFKEKDKGEKPWNHLSNILDNYKADFENWLNNERKANEIKNDDVTLLILKFV